MLFICDVNHIYYMTILIEKIYIQQHIPNKFIETMKQSLRLHTMPDLEQNTIFSFDCTPQLQPYYTDFKNLFERLQQLSKNSRTPRTKQNLKLFSTEKKIKLSNLQQAKQMQDRAANKLAEIQLLKTRKRHKHKQIYSLDLQNNLSESYSKRKYTSIYKEFLNDASTRCKNEQVKQRTSLLRSVNLPPGIKNQAILEKHPKIIHFIQQKIQNKNTTTNKQPRSFKIGDVFRKKQLQRRKIIKKQKQFELLKSKRADRKQQLSNSLVLTYLNKIFNVQKTMEKPEVRQQLNRYTSLDKYIFDESISASRYRKQKKEHYTPDSKETSSFK